MVVLPLGFAVASRVADVSNTIVAVFVVMLGGAAGVVNESSAPKVVPVLLLAMAQK